MTDHAGLDILGITSVTAPFGGPIAAPVPASPIVAHVAAPGRGSGVGRPRAAQTKSLQQLQAAATMIAALSANLQRDIAAYRAVHGD